MCSKSHHFLHYMKKSNIRSKYVKESLNDFDGLTNTLKENTTSAVRDLLNEAVRETYAKILTEDEDEDDEYDVEEVEDTNPETADAEKETDDVTDVEDTEMSDDADDADDDGVDVESSEGFDDDGNLTGETEASGEDENGGEWSEFEKYKVSDDEYDFSEAEDDEIVKVYKLLKDDDQVVVKKDDGKVSIKDNETGAEYIVALEDNDIDDDGEAEIELNLEDEDNDTMNESIIFEVALNEYDSNVGYTDNYQKKDVMTNPGMSEPGKGNDWDAGVPKGDSKPWSGRSGKKDDKPFDGEDGKTVEEATNVGGFVQQNTTSKSHVPNSNGRNARNASKFGRKIKGTPNPRYSDAQEGEIDESKSIVLKAKKIYNENKELKDALVKFKSVLKEAAVTNVNLGQIIKLISENTTSTDEKKEIIARFGKEAKTVESSKQLYESISNELKKRNKMNINEDKQFTTNGSQKINETQIYQSEDALRSLDLMHRLCK